MMPEALVGKIAARPGGKSDDRQHTRLSKQAGATNGCQSVLDVEPRPSIFWANPALLSLVRIVNFQACSKQPTLLGFNPPKGVVTPLQQQLGGRNRLGGRRLGFGQRGLFVPKLKEEDPT